jgi:addiction module HigA family antidote
MPPVHPGEILREDLMKPLGLTVNGLARELNVPVSRMSEIVNGRRPSMLIQLYAYLVILAAHRNSGSIFNQLTT